MSVRRGFVERSLMAALAFLKDSIFADESAAKPGLLQSIDPRIKLITFIGLLLLALFTKSIAILSCLYASCLLLAYFSSIHVGFFLKRTWIFIPLFSLVIAVPALFSAFTPGEPLLRIKVLWWVFTVTRQGLGGAILFVARVTTSVSFAVLLSLTTKHFELLKVLRSFRVPQVFVVTLGMCYRYIYLFVELIENIYLAIKSRVGTRLPYQKGQRIVAWNIASLWQRSYQLNEAVYDAMLSRGYTGEPVIVHSFRIRSRDWVWLIFVAVACALLVYWEYRIGC